MLLVHTIRLPSGSVIETMEMHGLYTYAQYFDSLLHILHNNNNTNYDHAINFIRLGMQESINFSVLIITSYYIVVLCGHGHIIPVHTQKSYSNFRGGITSTSFNFSYT